MTCHERRFKKIVFFNGESEVDEYLEDTSPAKSDSGDTLFISMTPAIHCYLNKKGFETEGVLRYFDSNSHMEALKKSAVLIEWLNRNSDFTDLGMGVKLAYKDFFSYWIRFAVHYCLWAIEVTSNVVALHRPEVICACLPGKAVVSSLYIESEENYFGNIVNRVARKSGIRFENFSKRADRGGDPVFSRKVNYASSLVKFTLQSIKFQLWETATLSRNVFAGRKPVFFMAKLYHMDKLAERLQSAIPDKHIYFLKGPVIFTFGLSNFIIRLFSGRYSNTIISQKKRFSDLGVKIAREKELFSYRDISFDDIIEEKIKDNIANHILGLMVWTVKLSQFIDASKPSAFISNGIRADEVILAELCRQRAISTILISHGTHVRPKNEYERIEWGEHGRALLRAPFSGLALQSTLSEGYLKVFPSEGRVIRTGPLIWGFQVNSERSRSSFAKMFNGRYELNETKIIVHAATSKPANSMRFYIYETPEEYIQSIRDVAAAVEPIPNAVLIVKFRPSKEISAEALKMLVPFSDKVVLSVEEPFLDVLGAASLLVSFSSTTIEEALQNRIPVLLYGGGGRYQHTPGCELKPGQPVLRSAVYHVTEAKDLGYALSGIFEMKIEGKGKDKNLFDEYIYDEGVKEHLESII